MRWHLFVSSSAFHITRVCIMHVSFVSVAFARLFVLVCLCLRVIVYAFAVVCCMVAFHIACVYSACLFWFVVFGLFVFACMLALRAIVHALAFLCCKVASHATRV